MAFPRPVSGSGLNQLTGDVTAGPGSGSQVATLAAVTTAQTVGDATHYPVITTDTKGRVTGAVATAVPSGALTSYAAVIAADIPVPLSTPTTILTTPALAIGTWLVTAIVQFQTLSTNTAVGAGGDIYPSVATGTMTFSGVVADGSIAQVTAVQFVQPLTINFLAVVTASGTINIVCEAGVVANVRAASPSYGRAGATGYTAVKIA